MQWAAVSTVSELRSIPPQNGPDPELSTSPTCQGNSPLAAASPPTILLLPRTPHLQFGDGEGDGDGDGDGVGGLGHRAGTTGQKHPWVIYRLVRANNRAKSDILIMARLGLRVAHKKKHKG